MDQENEQSILPDQFIWSFWQAAAQEIGLYSLNMILLKAGLDKFTIAEKSLPKREAVTTAEFGQFQSALRDYYGRGARGLLIRIGRGTWQGMSHEIPGKSKIKDSLLRWLPASLSARLALKDLAKFLRYPGSWVAVNATEKDIYYMDFTGLGCAEQAAGEPVCWTMVGLISGFLESITRLEYNVEEVACRAAGSEACKFRISLIDH